MTRLKYQSRLRKIIGNLRYRICKILHGGRLEGAWDSVIDVRCTLAIESTAARMSVGARCLINSDCFLFSNGTLKLGTRCFLNSYSRIVCHERIHLGDGVLFGPYASVIDHDHEVDFTNSILHRERLNTAPIEIGNNVWLGEKVTVLKGVTIGDNTVVGAGSVVTRSLPANCVAAGCPAKPIRELM